MFRIAAQSGADAKERKRAMSSPLFLRRVLAFDALSCLSIGLLTSLGANPLARLFGMPESLLLWAGLLLLPLAAFIGWLSSRAQPPALLVWVVIVGNLGWVVESFVVIGELGGHITPLGTLFVAAQALAVLALALLEYAGLRRARQAAAA